MFTEVFDDVSFFTPALAPSLLYNNSNIDKPYNDTHTGNTERDRPQMPLTGEVLTSSVSAEAFIPAYDMDIGLLAADIYSGGCWVS